MSNAAQNGIKLGMVFGIGYAVIGLVLGFIVNILTPINSTAGDGVNAILNIFFGAPALAVVTGVILLTLLGAVAPAIKPLWGLVTGMGGEKKKKSYD